MTILLSDDGTGKTDGTVLDTAKWTTEGTTGGTGGGATYQSTALRFSTGNQGAYNGASRVTRSFNITARADIEITGTFSIDSNEPYGLVYARATTSGVDVVNSYYLQLDKGGNLRVGKLVSYSGTSLGSVARTFAANTTYGFRFRVVGTSLKARTWTGTEPGTWDIDITDSTYTAAGKAGITVACGNATVNHRITFDGIVVEDGAGGAVMTETATVADALAVTAAVGMSEAAAVAEGFTVTQDHPLTGETLAVADALAVEVFQLHHDVRVFVEWTPGTWTDLTGRVKADQEVHLAFGRATRWDDAGPSLVMSLPLDNSDGALTPGNPSSPWYPNVVKGANLRVEIAYSGQAYPRFFGQIAGLPVPAFIDPQDAVCMVQAADIMASLARKTLLSTWTEEARRQARIGQQGVDVFPFPPSSVASDTSVSVASTTFENKGVPFTGSTRMGTITVMPAANGAGTVRSSGPESTGGALSEGQLQFTSGDNGFGALAHPVLVCKPQIGFTRVEILFRLAATDVPPESSTDDTEWILGSFWAGATEAFRIVVGNLGGAAVLAVKHAAGGAQYITEDRMNDDRWRKLTLYRTSTTTVRANINDSPSGAELTATDLATVTTVYLGGRASPLQSAGKQVQCPPLSLGGVAFYQLSTSSVPYWMVVGAPPANVTAADRFLELIDYADPITFPAGLRWNGALGTDPFMMKVVRTPVADRSVLDCLQELARTVGGYLWVEPDDGTLTMRKGAPTPTTVGTLDLVDDIDDTSPPSWQDTIDVQPTRVTARCPAGEATSINSAAETVGQYLPKTVDTCAPTVAVARSVADRFVAGQPQLALSELAVDLVHSRASLWGTLLPHLLPGETALEVTSVPQGVFGLEMVSGTVEAWEESYTVSSARLMLKTSPTVTASAPPLGSWSTTSATGVQTDGTVLVPQPPATAKGSLLVAIMTTDDTGTLADLTAPGPEWTPAGTGGSGSAGVGKVWTKVATEAEPPAYAFTVTGGASGPQTLLADSFPGADGAALDAGKWTAGQRTTGATASILGGAARVNPGSLTGGAGRSTLRPVVPDKADVDVVLSFKIANLDTHPVFILRATTSDAGAPQNGYALRPNHDASLGTRLGRVVAGSTSSGSGSVLGWIGGALTAGTWYRVRFQTIGSTVRARLWPAASAEPSSWGVTATDSYWTAAGPITLGAIGGDAVGSDVFLDDVVISDPAAVAGWPEASVRVLRVAGANATSPFVVAPTWTADASTTTEHPMPGLSPSEAGLMVAHWHILGTATGGGGGGGSTAVTWPISVDPDGHHLRDAAGRAFLYTADTGWMTISRLTVADAQQYIDIKSGQGFNTLQAALTLWSTSTAGDKGAPFTGGNLTTPNAAYWDDVDEIIAYAESKGMLCVLWPIWGANNGGWDGGSTPNGAAFATYCTWLGNRYKDVGNIAWAFGGDEQWETISSWVSGGWTALNNADPNHIMTYHPRWDNYNLAGDSRLDWNSTQHNDNTSPMTYELARTGYGYSKPYLLAEPPYVPSTAVGGVNTTNQRNRANGWWVVLGGALGVAYGGTREGTWNIGTGGVYDWTNTAHVSGNHTGNIRRILEQYPWQKMVPNWDSSVVTSSRGSYGGTSYVGVARAADGSMIAVYAPNGGTITVAMGQLAEGTGWARWYDPASGALVGAPISVTNSGSRSFAPPAGTNSAGDADWVLILAGVSTGPGAGTTPPGGGGGTVTGFSFGMSGFDSPAQIVRGNAWLTNHSLKAVGIWSDNSAQRMIDAEGLGPGEALADWTGVVDLAVGGPFGSETWAQAAGGSHDSRWMSSFATIRTKWGSRPPGNLHLRYGHEFNGDFSDWYVTPGLAADYKAAFRRWALMCRDELPGVQITWSPNDGFSGGAATIENVWPGADVVDVVGPDTYNAWPHASNLAEFNSKMLRVDGNGNPEGVEVWRQWAAGKGKPLALPEWGNRVHNTDGGGGGDHPVYVSEMLKWCKANAGSVAGKVKYAIYFNHGENQSYPVDYLVWDDGGALGPIHQPLTSAAIRAEA